MGRIIETRRWSNVSINLVDLMVGGVKVGKKIPDGVEPENAWTKGTLLSYSKTKYDIAGRVEMTIAVDKDGYEQPTSYEYDKAGKQIAVIDPLGHNVTYTQQGQWHIIDTVELNGTHRTETHYDGTRRDYVTDAEGRTTYFIYDCLGRLIKTIHPATSQNPVTYTHIGYDSLGRKVWESKQTIKADAGELTDADKKYFEYDSANRLTAAVLSPIADSENGNVSTYPRYEYKYDTYGNLTVIWDKVKEHASGAINYDSKRETKFTYDHLNNQVSRTLPGNRTEHRQYDQFGRVVRATDFDRQDTKYEYNGRGLPEFKKLYEFVDLNSDGENDNYPAGPAKVVQYMYDNLGRKSQVIEDRGTTTYRYDAEGHILVVASPEGYVRYFYNSITGQKTQTRSYSVAADLDTDVLAGSNNDFTRVEYTYDQLGRLKEVKTVKRDGSVLAAPEVTTYNYDAVGNRDSTILANNVTADYTYDNCNRLTNLTNTHNINGVLSSFTYTLYPDGMRHTVNETLKYPGGAAETHNITYTYDDLNRLTQESADTNPTGSGYTADYTYDLVGNRLSRTVAANGQTLTTEYQYYNDGSDRLFKEIHTGPMAAVPIGDERYYAYANSGGNGIFYKSADGKPISAIKAFFMGLPTEWSLYLFALILALAPVSFISPAAAAYLRRSTHTPLKRQAVHLTLWRRCLCVLLAYMMLLTPAGIQQVAHGAALYSDIRATNWGLGGRTIEYAYDNNGSCVTRTERSTTGGIHFATVAYDYDLQNRLGIATKQYNDGGDDIIEVTEYTYNEDGIRVKSYSYKTINDGNRQDEETKTFLIDAYNHTGYAQVLEEYDGTNRTTYTIGDDVVSQYNGTSVAHFIYDGHGSTRQLTNSSGGIVTDQVYNYDAYGVLLGHTAARNTNLLYAGEYFDSALQQYNLRARYYDPLNGRFNQVDTFSGNIHDPQSLHKYLYCHNNPINGTDPTGMFFSSLHYGKIVHDKIGKHFEATGFDRFYNSWINTILKTSNSLWGNNRPDLVDRGTIPCEVYEIKPVGEGLAGAAQLGWYLSLLNTNDPKKRTWVPGETYMPPSIISIDPTCFALVQPPQAGIIIYRVVDAKPAITAIAAYATYRITAEVAAYVLIRMVSPGLALF